MLLGACAPSGISYLPPPPMNTRPTVVETTTSPPAPCPTENRLGSPGTGTGAVLARVGGKDITAEDLAREFFKTNRDQAFATLNKLVVRQIVKEEAARLGLKVPDEYLAAEKKRVLEDLNREALKSFGMGATPERYVEVFMKQPLADFLRQREADASERYLVSRVIRYHAIQTDRVELQLITLDDEPTAREVAQKLDQGADFGQLAVGYSKHPSGKSGGHMPPVSRGSLNPAVGDRAFALREGERTSILSVDDGLGRRQFEIVKVVRRLPGRNVPWAQVASEIEEGLKLEPVSQDEFIAWNLGLERLYGVWFDPQL